MRQRRLFYALDKEGKKHNINDIDKNNKIKFFCPHCRQEVYPKLGTQKTWHFSHKHGIACSDLKEPDTQLSDSDIFSFASSFKAGVEFELDNSSYKCPICKKVKKKEFGIHYKGDVYLCKECFSKAGMSDLDTLL